MSNNRFERMIQFILDAQQAENIALQENPVGGRDFLKKIGSNFLIADRTLSFSLKDAWKIAAKYHVEAQRVGATNSEIGECIIWRCTLVKYQPSGGIIRLFSDSATLAF